MKQGWKNRERIILIRTILLSLGVMGVYVYIFFGKAVGILPAILVGVDCFMNLMEGEKRRITSVRRMEFRNMLRILGSVLAAGYSLEQAFFKVREELIGSVGEGREIIREVEKIERALKLNEPVDRAIAVYAENMQLEEIYDFAEVLAILQRQGGNTVQVIEDTIHRVAAGMDLKEETETMIMARRLELTIMIFMPALMVLYLKMTNMSYMAPLYETGVGFFIMSTALCLNVGADYLGRRIIYGETSTSKKSGGVDRKKNTAFLSGKNKKKYQKSRGDQ